MHKTLVVVEDTHSIPEQYRYFLELLGDKIMKAHIHRGGALIETPTHRIHIVTKAVDTTGFRCNHLIYLGEKDEVYFTKFLSIVRSVY